VGNEGRGLAKTRQKIEGGNQMDVSCAWCQVEW
jgi:hypothetical protein